jgi:hypothetical protein
MSEIGVPQTLPGMEGAALNVLDEAQIRSAQARALFELEGDAAPWMDEYFGLIAEGWSWRQAVFMLWLALPRRERRPSTQERLAVEVLGLTSDRTLREWRAGNAAMDVRVAKLVSSAIGHARAEVFQALVAAATNVSPRAHSDRKLFFEMTGDYVPRQKVALGVDVPDDLGELSAEDLRALAAAPEHGLGE